MLAAASRGPEVLHIKDKRRVRRDDTAGAARAIAQLRRDDETATAAGLHRWDAVAASDAHVPALDDLAGANAEGERPAAVVRAVKLHSVALQLARVVCPAARANRSHQPLCHSPSSHR